MLKTESIGSTRLEQQLPDSEHKYNASRPVTEPQPVQYLAVKPTLVKWEAQPVQYQAVAHMSVTNGVMSGQHQAMNQALPVHYPLTHAAVTQYHAMAQEAPPVQYQYQIPKWVSGYVTSTPVVPALHNVVNATRYVSDNVAAPFGQRALPPGQQKSRLQSLPKALVYDGRGSWQDFLTKFDKYSTIFEWKDRKKRDYLELNYLEVVDKLERRFGYRDLPEMARMMNRSMTGPTVIVASESRLVEKVVVVERNEDMLDEKMDICMGMLD
ncbi:hypothetical protein DPMN_137032 [Dreissena polymorpha]|uniref:Uncharacterized protein n=1 Tax=Dreissena polymorpha TaxID=45954 RepID=A0A9D4G119_DREPO|nr:hypothetical protein DPMN_137032 [Dreissena polymorpha]